MTEPAEKKLGIVLYNHPSLLQTQTAARDHAEVRQFMSTTLSVTPVPPTPVLHAASSALEIIGVISVEAMIARI